LLQHQQRRGLPNYLSVLKRHRPDAFLFSHAVDGYSLAMDFRVTRTNRAALQKLADEMTEMVLQAGGRFYFAKDSLLSSKAAACFLGQDTLRRFRELKQRCDPEHRLQTELYRRLLAAAP
jgi:FAD/FMN-containing dehydrogenase